MTLDADVTLRCSRRVDGRWVAAAFEDFAGGNSDGSLTCIVIHGNRIENSEAIREGLLAYRRISAYMPENRPLRWVIWSWPSDREHGVLRDLRSKAARANSEAKYVAWALARLDPHAPVGLLGFSFGARITTGALHELASGAPTSHETVAALPERNAVLVAAAVDSDWLAAGHPHGRALESVETMTLINNHCDALLRRYHWLDRFREPEALGVVGASGRSPLYTRLRQTDACRQLGKTHDWELYLNSTVQLRQMAAGLLGPNPAELATAKR